LVHENQSLEHRFNKLQSEYISLNSSNTEQHKEIITYKSSNEQAVWKHNEDIRKIKSQLDNMNSDIERVRNEKNELAIQLSDAEEK